MAYKSKAGTNDYGFTKTNQDNYIISENIFSMDNYNIFAVLDGHGKKI
jgi:serine/threonine protein phosphatase PrpC